MNKIYRTLILAALAALSMGAIAQTAGPNGGPPAQGGGAGARGDRAGKHGGAMLMRLTEKLNLTAEQKTKLKAMHDKNMAARKEMMEQVKSGKITKEQAKEKMKGGMKNQMEALKSILTKDQMAQLTKELQAMRQKGGKDQKNKVRKPGKPGTPPPAV